MSIEDLIGKTIATAEVSGMPGYDDTPYLTLTFEDNTSITIVADYGGYTGNSEDEYPRYISVSPLNFN